MTEYIVSIIIPVYNAEKYLAETIQSAIGQTWPNTEIIIVDDGSTDNSVAIARRYEGDKVKIYQQENKGASAARNKGLSHAKGSYIQFLDADDILSADKIKSQVVRLNGSMDHIGLCKTVHFQDGDDYTNTLTKNEWYFCDNDDPLDFLKKLYAGEEIMPAYGGMIQPNAWLTPANVIKKAGNWNEQISVDDDGEFFCRVILSSRGIKFSPAGINYYRKVNNQLSLSAKKNYSAYKNAVLATDLKYSYLKATTNDPIIDKIFSRHYWWTGVAVYPQFLKLSAYCIKQARQLQYSGPKYVGGQKGHLLAKFLGWKFVRCLAYCRAIIK